MSCTGGGMQCGGGSYTGRATSPPRPSGERAGVRGAKRSGFEQNSRATGTSVCLATPHPNPLPSGERGRELLARRHIARPHPTRPRSARKSSSTRTRAGR
jgi:hypothetical protein